MNVKINSANPTKSKGGKFYQQINYDNDLKASAWDDDFVPLVNQTVDVEITEKNGFKNVKLVAGGVKPTSTPAPTKETNEVDARYKAFVLALEVLKATAATITESSLINEAVKIEGFLRNGFPQENKG